jgi:hypothetical protein
MRRSSLVVAFVLAACNSGRGVDIEIAAPPSVAIDRVEVWVTYDECYDSSCPNGIAWTQGERADGYIRFLRDEAIIKAEPRGDRFVLHMEAAEGFADPSSIAFVGFSGDKAAGVKVLHYVHIPINSVEIWKVQLHAVDPATTDLDTPPASDSANDYRAHVWARRPTSALAEPMGCLVYQAWDEYKHTWHTEYFVPDSDPDCDGQAIECSEYWYNYKPQGRCVTDTGLEMADVCGVGISACADGVSSSTTCSADPMLVFTCLPDDFCKHCDGEVPVDSCIEHAVGKGLEEGTLPHYSCAFDAPIESLPCPDQHVKLQLPLVQATCATPQLHYLDKPFAAGAGELVFGSSTNQVKISATVPAGGCVAEIYWKAGKLDAFPDGITFLIEVPYTNGKNAMYPVTIRPSNQTITCASTPIGTCVHVGPTTDRVDRCAAF